MARDPHDCSLCGDVIPPDHPCIFNEDQLHLCLPCFAHQSAHTYFFLPPDQEHKP